MSNMTQTQRYRYSKTQPAPKRKGCLGGCGTMLASAGPNYCDPCDRREARRCARCGHSRDQHGPVQTLCIHWTGCDCPAFAHGTTADLSFGGEE